MADTYKSWYEMRRRCSEPKNPSYQYYGGRGIKVDPHWSSYNNFLLDMGERPDGLSLERIDNEQGYYKANCKWATREEQAQNQRLRRDNQTGIKGLFWSPSKGIWIARRRKNHVIKNLYQGKSYEKAKLAIDLYNEGN